MKPFLTQSDNYPPFPAKKPKPPSPGTPIQLAQLQLRIRAAIENRRRRGAKPIEILPESESSEQTNSSPSPTLNPLPRLWRPAAQRNIRNQWSKLSSYRKQWVISSSAARSHATSLINAYLNHKYLPSMEMSVFRDMPDIKIKACQKLLKQQELHLIKILSYYKDMVTVVTQMVNCSRSMRCFLKATNSPILQFSSSSEDKNDTGDCGDIPVFVFLSISSFEKSSEEITQMYAMELRLKRLLVLKLLSISSEASQAQKLCWSDEFYPGEFDDLSACNLYSQESREPIPPSLEILKSATPVDECSIQPNREILQVYLTTWLAEVSSGLSNNMAC